MRIITHSHFRSHTSGLFKRLNVLKINDLCALQDYKFCYKFHHSMLPHYFLSDMKKPESSKLTYDTRYANNIKLPVPKHDFARYCMTNKYPYILSSIPKTFSQKIITHSFLGYKSYIKRSVIENYSSECTIPNCYICSLNTEKSILFVFHTVSNL